MARTKPTLKESLERRSELPWQSRTAIKSVKDYNSASVNIVWSLNGKASAPLPPFPFHVFVLRKASQVSINGSFCDLLLAYIHTSDWLSDPCWHLEVFDTKLDNVLACAEHFEKAMEFRNNDSKSPYLPAKRCFLVVDFDDWKDQGLLSVEYSVQDKSLPYALTAKRYRRWKSLECHLREQWASQGMTMIEEALDGKNVNRGWPIDVNLYDEAGPDQAAEYTDCLGALSMRIQDGTLRASLAPDASPLDPRDSNVEEVFERRRSGSTGVEYTELRHQSSQGFILPFCLFLVGKELSSEVKKTLFARLNTGLLAQVPWKLHVYSVTTMSDALSILTHEMGAREAKDFANDLPSSYAVLPLQEYRYLCMMMDTSKDPLLEPKFVLSNPEQVSNTISSLSDFVDICDELHCQMFHLGTWDLIADMLHTHYTLYLQAHPSFRPLSDILPSISLHITVQPRYFTASGNLSPIKLELSTHAVNPITVNVTNTLLSPYFWTSCLRIVDVETSLELPKKDSAKMFPRLRFGPHILELGFSKNAPDGEEYSPAHVITLFPDVTIQLPVPEMHIDELEEGTFNDGVDAPFDPAVMSIESVLKECEGQPVAGKKYCLEPVENTDIKTWTWGAKHSMQGPFGLPPLTIELAKDSLNEFMFVE